MHIYGCLRMHLMRVDYKMLLRSQSINPYGLVLCYYYWPWAVINSIVNMTLFVKIAYILLGQIPHCPESIKKSRILDLGEQKWSQRINKLERENRLSNVLFVNNFQWRGKDNFQPNMAKVMELFLDVSFSFVFSLHCKFAKLCDCINPLMLLYPADFLNQLL